MEDFRLEKRLLTKLNASSRSLSTDGNLHTDSDQETPHITSAKNVSLQRYINEAFNLNDNVYVADQMNEKRQNGATSFKLKLI